MTAAKLRELEAKATEGSGLHWQWKLALLDRKTQEIIKLIEAAEQLVNGGHPDEAIHHMTKALAALNKE